jgi:K+-transporting ATPase c subunit
VDKDDAHRAVKVASLSPEAKEAAKEVGLDDNRSALLQAAKVNPERQAAVIRDIAEARSSGIDRDLKIEAARNVASRLAERFPASEWDWLKSSLYAAGAKLIADAFVNETGAGVATMDKAGWQ